MAWNLYRRKEPKDRGGSSSPGTQKKGNLYNIQRTPCVVTNYGNGFRYVFLSQSIPDLLFDAVNTEQANLHKEIAKKYKDVTAEVSRHEDRIMVSASYAYHEKTSEGAIKDRLVYLMENSRRIIRETMKHSEKALETARKKLESKELDHLTRDEFICLVDDGYENLKAKPHNEAVEGFWEYTWDERAYEVFNYGNRVVLSISTETPDNATDAQRSKVLEEAGKLVSKKAAKGAAETEVLWYPGYSNCLWLRATYPLDGEIKGKDFSKNHKEFIHNYAKEMDKKLVKIIDKQM
jgi:hypothetical protein